MLSVRNIDLHYGASQALRDVGFEARLGEVTCVLGRNGVGKTSLLSAIMGLRKTSRGQIAFNDQDVTRKPAHDRARLGFADGGGKFADRVRRPGPEPKACPGAAF
jgi:urea transport system ATP-binding protein